MIGPGVQGPVALKPENQERERGRDGEEYMRGEGRSES